MRFQLSEVHHDADEFEELVACEIASFEHPQQSIFRFFYPIFGHESAAQKQTAFQNLVELQRQWSRDDPDVVWIKAIDTQNNNKIVGGLLMSTRRALLLTRTKMDINLPSGILPVADGSISMSACAYLRPRMKNSCRGRMSTYILALFSLNIDNKELPTGFSLMHVAGQMNSE
ncbi:hypothetical protein IFM53868_07040 [Aspergillus udagawae]|uniref:N-acetyltransferase domain-containing protein n=1 Tax=Aspergillus udagawae TaxID=91492 RepID=A0ABQ1B3C7_9EURO|nr:hypothetical protein IFM53868_07040 [Aspergillus udagawae]